MKKSFLPKNWWWKLALLTSITTSVIVYTYKNEIFGHHPTPSLNPVVHYDQTNTIPILNYLTEAKKQKVPLHFSIPNYDNDPAEIFRYLATRVISIAVVSTNISSTLDLFDFNNSFNVNFGTATILGPASDPTKNGQDYQYYLASNVHVLENFIQSSNKRIIGTYFGFNHFFLDQLKNNLAPKVADLENKENKLKINFYQNKVISQYFPFQVQNDFHYLAKDIQVKNLQFAHTRNYWSNFPTSIQSFSPNIKKQFAADFGVIKVNLQPTTPLPLFSQLLSWSFFDSYQLPKIAINSDLNKRNEYLSQLKNNISKYGGLKFSKNSVNTGYMMSYPGVNTPQDNSSGKDLISINLKLDYLANRLVKQKIPLLSNNKNYKFPFQTPSSPTVDYVVPALNLLPGSSGSPLITYDPNQNDFNKFQMNGIYWGITYWSNQNHPNKDHQVSKINGSNGMITKLIVDNDYDLIGIGNQPTNNSLCAKIKINNSYSPDFCSSALVLGK